MSMASKALTAAGDYLRRNPGEITRVIRNLIGLRAGVPIDALRWLLGLAAQSGKLEDPVLTEVPPGIRFTATIDAMKTPVRASAVVFIDRLVIDPEQIRFEVRLEEIWMEVIGESTTPIAALLRSGALDLSKPGNLAKHLDLPPVIVEAKDNKLAIDLMKDPKIAENPVVKRALAVITPIVTVHNIETGSEHFDVVFRAFPQGLRTAAGAVRQHLFRPSLRRVKALLPSFL
jgi:hypothetical protein